MSRRRDVADQLRNAIADLVESDDDGGDFRNTLLADVDFLAGETPDYEDGRPTWDAGTPFDPVDELRCLANLAARANPEEIEVVALAMRTLANRLNGETVSDPRHSNRNFARAFLLLLEAYYSAEEKRG